MSHPARSELAQPDYDGHFAMIPLTKGKFAIVDEADAEMVLNGKGWWAAVRSRHTWYAKRSDGRQPLGMHALITGYPMVDHANRNGLDNRRINLRPTTPSRNAVNRPPQRNNTSGYKGVYWHRPRRKWYAAIGVNGRIIRLGYFTDPVEAARAYNQAALEHFGEFAWLNPLPDATAPPAA